MNLIESFKNQFLSGIAYVRVPSWWHYDDMDNIRNVYIKVAPIEFEYKPGTNYTMAGWVRKRPN